MKPGERSVRGGFFVREPRGSLNLAQSYQEFEMALPRSAEGVSAVRQIAEQVSSSLAAQHGPSPDADTQRRRGGSRRDITEMPQPVSTRPPEPPRPVPASQNSAAAAAAPALEAPTPAQPAWSPAVARPRSAIVTNHRSERLRRLKWRWLVVWLVAIGCIVAAAYAYREFTAPAPLGLFVAEKDGDLIIQWDSSARPLRWATSGRIEIRGSGQTKTEIDLTTNELAAGKYQYGGTEGDTSIRLSIAGKFGFHADESARYVAQLAPSEPSGAKPVEIRDRRKLQAEVRRLREELEKSEQRVKELESLLNSR